jgi:hypothetical protein
MATASSDKNLAALIKRVRDFEGDQSAWRTVRAILAVPVQAAIQREWDDAAADGFPAEPDIPRRIEAGFWRMRWDTRAALPSSPDLFRAEMTRSAGAHAHDVVAEYRLFQQLLARCRTDTEGILQGFLSSPNVPRDEDLAGQVRERLWDLRHQLPSDCQSLNHFVAETAREMASISSLFRRSLAGELRAMDELFTIFQQHMEGVCRSVFPEIREHERKDILQNAMIKLLSGMPRTLDPCRLSTWRGFLRTVVFHAGIDWIRRNGRYVSPPGPETGNNG